MARNRPTIQLVTTGSAPPSRALLDEVARRAGIRLTPTLFQRIIRAVLGTR